MFDLNIFINAVERMTVLSKKSESAWDTVRALRIKKGSEFYIWAAAQEDAWLEAQDEAEAIYKSLLDDGVDSDELKVLFWNTIDSVRG